MNITSETKFLFYQDSEGAVQVNVQIDGETIWLTPATIADLFGCTVDNVYLHLKIYTKQENYRHWQLPRISR